MCAVYLGACFSNYNVWSLCVRASVIAHVGLPEAHWARVLAALPKFAQLIYCPDEEILKDVCWSLSCISSSTKDRIQAIVDLEVDICRRLVELLGYAHAAAILVGHL